jgi:hypothetical protein
MSKELSFLEGDAPEVEEVATPVETPDVGLPISAEPAPEPVAPAPPPPEPGHVPLAAMLDERDKRQALEKRLADYQAREEALARAAADPPGLEAQVEQRLYAANLNASRRFAEREYGKETVATVHQWAADRCDADPIFNQQMRSADDPYEAAMQAYNRDRVAAEVTAGDLDAFRAWKAATAQVQAATPVPSPSSPAVAIPRSLANAPGNGS